MATRLSDLVTNANAVVKNPAGRDSASRRVIYSKTNAGDWVAADTLILCQLPVPARVYGFFITVPAALTTVLADLTLSTRPQTLTPGYELAVAAGTAMFHATPAVTVWASATQYDNYAAEAAGTGIDDGRGPEKIGDNLEDMLFTANSDVAVPDLKGEYYLGLTITTVTQADVEVMCDVHYAVT